RTERERRRLRVERPAARRRPAACGGPAVSLRPTLSGPTRRPTLRADALSRASSRGRVGAVPSGRLRGELAAGGVDVTAAREADGDGDPALDEDGLEGGDRLLAGAGESRRRQRRGGVGGLLLASA